MSERLPPIEELLELVYRYYPRGVERDSTSNPSPEMRLRWEASQRAWENRQQWSQLIERLEKALPGSWISDETVPRFGGTYWCRVYPPRFSQYRLNEYLTAVGMVSYLAPVYLVYSSFQKFNLVNGRWHEPILSHHPEGEIEPFARAVAREIEEVFGYPALPVETAMMTVPDIQLSTKRFGEVRLIDCLFLEERR